MKKPFALVVDLFYVVFSTKPIQGDKKRQNRAEVIGYLFWGGVTTVFNIGLFAVLDRVFYQGLNKTSSYLIANFIATFLTKALAYVTSKFFVFRTKSESFGQLAGEMLRFIVARLATWAVEYFGLIIMIEMLSVYKMTSKVVMTVIVVIFNYVLGKWGVFNKKDKTKRDTPRP